MAKSLTKSATAAKLAEIVSKATGADVSKKLIVATLEALTTWLTRKPRTSSPCRPGQDRVGEPQGPHGAQPQRRAKPIHIKAKAGGSSSAWPRRQGCDPRWVSTEGKAGPGWKAGLAAFHVAPGFCSVEGVAGRVGLVGFKAQ